jgi:hypothetical protein
MTPAQARRDRRALLKEIAKDERLRARQHLLALKDAIQDARAAHRQSLVHAKESCRSARLNARRGASELRARLLLELRAAVAAERHAAHLTCAQGRKLASEAKERRSKTKLELAAERQFRREIKRIERSNRARRSEIVKASRKERGAESDDTVRGNIPPELVALFERVKGRIKAGDRWTRTEAFLHYAEEHPREVLASIEDESEAKLADLERQYRDAQRASRAPVRVDVYAEEAPF